MDRKYIEDHHIVDRYLADTLSDEERSAFEAHYHEHPEIAQEMELVARMKVGMARLEERGEFAASIQRKQRYSLLVKLSAVAAIVCVALGMLLLVPFRFGAAPLLGRSLIEITDRSQQPLITTEPHLITRRRNTYDGTIILPAQERALLIRLSLGIGELASSYRVTVRTAGDGTLLGEVDGLQPSGRFIDVYLNSAKIRPGSYDFVTSPSATAKEDGLTYRVLFEPFSSQ